MNFTQARANSDLQKKIFHRHFGTFLAENHHLMIKLSRGLENYQVIYVADPTTRRAGQLIL